jgi:hypothetical protein
LPFLVISAAGGISSASTTFEKVLPWVLVLSLALVTNTWTRQLAHLEEPAGYKSAAEFIKEHVSEGDLVVTDNVAVFWGLMRYGVGPDWGRPLEVDRMEDNEAWKGLKKRLGSRVTKILHLNPKRDYVDHDGVRYVISSDASGHGERGETIWLVFDRYLSDEITVGRPSQPVEVIAFGRLAVVRTEQSVQGIDAIKVPRSDP